MPRDEGQEQPAVAHHRADLALPVASRWDAVLVEEDRDPGGFERRLQDEDGGAVLARVAQEHGAGRDGHGYRGRYRHDGLRPGRAALAPTAVQLGHEGDGIARQVDLALQMAEEQHQVGIAADHPVGHEVLHQGGALEETLIGHGAHEEARQPVREAAAQEQEMTALERLEEPRADVAARGQEVHQLQGVLIAKRVLALAARATEDLQHRATPEGARLTGEVLGPAARRPDDARDGIVVWTGAGRSQGVVEEAIEGGGDIQGEIGDLRELPEGRRGLAAQFRAHLVQEALELAVGAGGMPAGRGAGHGHLVEPEAAGELAGREAERHGEPLGEMALERCLPAIHGYGEQLLPCDRDHLTALDVAEQILPIEVVTAVIHGRVDLISQLRPGPLEVRWFRKHSS